MKENTFNISDKYPFASAVIWARHNIDQLECWPGLFFLVPKINKGHLPNQLYIKRCHHSLDWKNNLLLDTSKKTECMEQTVATPATPELNLVKVAVLPSIGWWIILNINQLNFKEKEYKSKPRSHDLEASNYLFGYFSRKSACLNTSQFYNMRFVPYFYNSLSILHEYFH